MRVRRSAQARVGACGDVRTRIDRIAAWPPYGAWTWLPPLGSRARPLSPVASCTCTEVLGCTCDSVRMGMYGDLRGVRSRAMSNTRSQVMKLARRSFGSCRGRLRWCQWCGHEPVQFCESLLLCVREPRGAFNKELVPLCFSRYPFGSFCVFLVHFGSAFGPTWGSNCNQNAANAVVPKGSKIHLPDWLDFWEHSHIRFLSFWGSGFDPI